MTTGEIVHLEQTVGQRLRHDPTWIKAFQFYNKANKPLTMGCRPCYGKVLHFIKNI